MAEVPRSGHHGSKLHQSRAGDPQLAGAWNERILSDSGTSAVALVAGDKGGGREWNADTLLPKVWNADTLLPKVTQQLRTLYPWCQDMPLQDLPLRFETLAKQQTKLMLQELYADSTGNIPGNTGLCDSHPMSDVPLDFGPPPGVQTHDPALLNVKTCDPATHHVKARGFKEAASPTSTISSGLQPSTPDTCYQSHVTFQYANRAFQGVDEFPFECWDPLGVPPKPPPGMTSGMTSALVAEPVLPNDSCCSKVRQLCLDKANVKSVRPPLKPTSSLFDLLSNQRQVCSTSSQTNVKSVRPPLKPTSSLFGLLSNQRQVCSTSSQTNVKSVRPPLKPPLGTKILPTKQQRSPITDSATSVTSAKPSSSRQDCQPSSVAMATGVMTNTQRLRPSCGNKKTFVLEKSQPAGRPKTNKPSFSVKSDSVGRHGQHGQVTDKEKRLKRQDNRRTDDNVPYPVVVEDWEDEIEQFPAGFMGNYQPHKLKLFQSRDKGEENVGESKLKGIPGLVVNAPQKQASGRSKKSSRAEEQPEGKTQMENAATKDRCLQDGSNVPHQQQWVKDRCLQDGSNVPYQQQWVKIGKQGKLKKKAQRKEKV